MFLSLLSGIAYRKFFKDKFKKNFFSLLYSCYHQKCWLKESLCIDYFVSFWSLLTISLVQFSLSAFKKNVPVDYIHEVSLIFFFFFFFFFFFAWWILLDHDTFVCGGVYIFQMFGYCLGLSDNKFLNFRNLPQDFANPT